MKTLMRIGIWASLLLFSIVLFSFTNPPAENAKLLTKVWKFDDMTVEGVAALTPNLLQQSQHTDYLKLDKNGKYELFLFGETNTGKWKLMENQTRLLLDGGTDDASIFRLIELDDKTLIIGQLDTDTRKTIYLKFHAK